jgi:hypothetical protein
MKNLLKLHEAIAVVLLKMPERTAPLHEIAKEISRRGLYFRKDRKPLAGYQVMMRSKLSKGRYLHLFQLIGQDKVKLI